MSINIHDDTRNRGLEVLLYQPEKTPDPIVDDKKRFRVEIVLPLFFGKKFNFNFEIYIDDKQKLSEQD